MSAQSRQVFINLPVDDVTKSTEFFTELGFSFDSRFADERANCMILNDQAYVMLLAKDFYQTFTKKDLCNTATHNEGIFCVSASSREDVDELVHKALAAGGQPSNEAMDHGFMYGWSFQDIDGHLWEVMFMDPNANPQES